MSPKSIAEMRQSPLVGRVETTAKICVAGKLQAELEAVDAEMIEFLSRAEVAEQDQGRRRLNELPAGAEYRAQAEVLAERADELRDQMADHTVDVRFRAKESGEWRNWVIANPARDDDMRDQRTMQGVCNADALVASLGEYVVEVNGTDPGQRDWDFIAENAAPAALLDAARKVMQLHETVVSLGKSRRAWLLERTSANESSSQSTSEQASDD